MSYIVEYTNMRTHVENFNIILVYQLTSGASDSKRFQSSFGYLRLIILWTELVEGCSIP